MLAALTSVGGPAAAGTLARVAGTTEHELADALARLARRNTEHGSGLGTLRWIVERTFAWLDFFRRLRIRWERLPELHEAFMRLGRAVVCQRYFRGTRPDPVLLTDG